MSEQAMYDLPHIGVRMHIAQVIDSETGNTRPEIDFTVEDEIGSGSFGHVYKILVHGKTDARLCALKRVYQDRRYRNRELSVMIKLGTHENICSLITYFYCPANDGTQNNWLCLVMEYFHDSSYEAMKQFIRRTRDHVVPMFYVKLFSYQIGRGLHYMHIHNIAHRDIKPQNVLVNSQTGRTVVCDMGSAKPLNPAENNISYICSRYYRAPELIFENTSYSTSIDCWSFACVVAEFLIGAPLFQGANSRDQITKIMELLQPPTRQDVYEMNQKINDYVLPEVTQRISLRTILRGRADQITLDFFSKLLCYSPKRRMTCIEAMAHPFFDELRREPERSSVHRDVKLFNFTQFELQDVPPEVCYRLVPAWYMERNAAEMQWLREKWNKGKDIYIKQAELYKQHLAQKNFMMQNAAEGHSINRSLLRTGDGLSSLLTTGH